MTNAGIERGVAVIGMSGRFPGAATLSEFWSNLCDGVESISFAGGLPKGALAGKEMFDAHLFGINPREAEITDPQHRIFLECALEALETAGYGRPSPDFLIGVFAGASPNWYGQKLYADRSLRRRMGISQLMIGNDDHFLATRVSYKLDLRGPSIVIKAACSTSLVAVHYASQSVLNGECDIAIAGGVGLPLSEEEESGNDAGIVSADGHCRAFDAAANGTIPGEGAGAVVLKRLADARRDGDFIHAIIRGSAVNNDGFDKASYTAPSADAQAAVISEAMAVGGVDPATINYVEAHGTATLLGDPIEVAALNRAFASSGLRSACALGSVKTNIGHLDAAAGVAGLIKVILALRHKQIPPSLHFHEPNPCIRFDEGPFFVNRELVPWRNGSGPRRAGVNSFGFGGTNAHVVVEEAPPDEPSSMLPSRPFTLWAVSAQTQTALNAICSNLAAHLEQHAELNVHDAAFTQNIGRRDLRYRRAIVSSTRAEAIARLAGETVDQVFNSMAEPRERWVRFLFPGQGSQYVHMTQGLYEAEPTFRRYMDRSLRLFTPLLDIDLKRVLYPSAGEKQSAIETLDQTATTQPALFAVEYALAQMWMEWGIQPQAMLGHSIGEYVAACMAGVFSEQDAARLVVSRGRLIQSLPAGGMVALSMSASEAEQFLSPSLSLAAVNAPSLCVLSGESGAVEALERHLREIGVEHRRLRTSHAFHSAMMDPILHEFAEEVDKIERDAPKIPYVSNLTGTWITAAQATSAEYWVRHLRQTVRFADGASLLLQDSDSLFVEVGPGRTLAGLLRQQPMPKSGTAILSSLRPVREPGSDLESALETLGKAWLCGVTPNWKNFYANEQRHRVPLPTYPFERQRFWAVKDERDALHVPSSSPEPEAVSPAEEENPGHLYHRPALSAGYVAPQTLVEEKLAAVWQEFLGIQQIGVRDNFFELGGHSLMATRMISRLRKLLGVEISAKEFFDGPTIAALAATVEQTDTSRARAESTTAVRISEAAVRLTSPLVLPASFAQRRLWLFDQLQPGDAAYNIPSGLWMEGPLDVRRLHESLQQIVDRHETMRAHFEMREGSVVQVTAANMEASLRIVDLSGLNPTERSMRVGEHLREEARAPFDLSRGPLWRAMLIKCAPQEHALVLNLHHSITDAWSTHLLWNELRALYEGRTLAPLPIQYGDFAVWQQEWFDSGVLQDQLSFWKGQLAGMPGLLELPTDRPRPAFSNSNGARKEIFLSMDLVEALKQLSREEQGTLFMTLLTGFQTLLARYTEQQDFGIGIPIAGRNREEVEGLIGFFVNTLVLRADLSGEPGFRDVLRRVKTRTLAAYAHQDLPFERLVEMLQPDRSLTHAPLFQVMFDLQNVPGEEWTFAGLRTREVQLDTGTTEADLVLTAAELPTGLEVRAEYSTALFDEEKIAALLQHYENLLRDAVRHPDRSIWEMELLSSRERQHQIDLARSPKPIEGFKCVHELFREQARKTPEAIAAISGMESLTYQALDEKAERLASYLQLHGAGPECPIGIFMERSPEMLVAVLGVLKAGAAYLPIDPACPKERMNYMLADSGATVLLVRHDLEPGQRRPDGFRWLRVDQAIADAPEPAGRQGANVSGSNLACVFYTSGSTGKPKGVMITHASLGAYAETAANDFDIHASDRVLQFASIAFDASAEEIFPCLARGATLVLRGEIHSPSDFLRCCAEQQISVLDLPTAYWHVLVDSTGEADWRRLTALRLVVLGGEAVAADKLQTWNAKVSRQVRLCNTYGPTEATVVATSCELNSPTISSSVPVGRPVRGAEVYLLDGHLQPAPKGMPGELYIAGSGIARGYLGAPGMTAERFLPHPFSAVAGARLFRTGDRARRLADGSLEFLGRTDDQIKLRGYRIELGEIEAALREAPGVLEAAVVAAESPHSGKRLVAFLVSVSSRELEAQALRLHLRARLPEYMVPSTFVTLESLPLTANGKVDKNALRVPAIEIEPPHLAEESDLEGIIAGVWKRLLHVETIGCDQNFFDLGAHSLLVIQARDRLQKELKRDVAAVDLFSYPTIRSLAQHLGRSGHDAVGVQQFENRARLRKLNLSRYKATNAKLLSEKGS